MSARERDLRGLSSRHHLGGDGRGLPAAREREGAGGESRQRRERLSEDPVGPGASPHRRSRIPRSRSRDREWSREERTYAKSREDPSSKDRSSDGASRLAPVPRERLREGSAAEGPPTPNPGERLPHWEIERLPPSEAEDIHHSREEHRDFRRREPQEAMDSPYERQRARRAPREGPRERRDKPLKGGPSSGGGPGPDPLPGKRGLPMGPPDDEHEDVMRSDGQASHASWRVQAEGNKRHPLLPPTAESLPLIRSLYRGPKGATAMRGPCCLKLRLLVIGMQEALQEVQQHQRLQPVGAADGEAKQRKVDTPLPAGGGGSPCMPPASAPCHQGGPYGRPYMEQPMSRGRVSWMPFGGGPMGLRPPFGPLGAPGVPPFLPMGNAGGPHGPAGPQGSGGPMGPPPMGAFPKGPNGMPPPLEGAPGPGGPPFLEPGGSPQGVGPGQHMQPPPPPFLRAVGGRGGSHSSGLPLEAAPSATGTEAQSRMRGPQMGTAPPMGLEMGGAPHHPRAGPPFFMAAHMHLQGGPGMPPPPPPEAFGMRGMPPDWVHGPPGGPPIGPSIPHLGPLMHPPQGDPACSAAAGDVAAFSGYTTGEGPLRTGEQGGPPLGGSPVPRGDIVDGQQQQAGVGVGGLVDAGEEAAVTKTPEEAEEEALFAWLEQVGRGGGTKVGIL
ncbi:hypothetical protein cyc_00155 [Cyclospora cayetanensis]|uniref:Uncharacterized protein n=1 Tax=Cyclospora cayetanensis TaxID=88456 RepID=A0A1D3D0A6_9EIME|nr:hypothetical protein cyc_00155 [Cyclospora cayetanensis]